MRADRIKLKAKREQEFVLEVASLARSHRDNPEAGVAAVQKMLTEKKIMTDEQNLVWLSRGAISKEFATATLDLLVDLVFISQPQMSQEFPEIIEKWLDRNVGLVLRTYFENEGLSGCEEMIFEPYTNLGWVMRNDEEEEARRDRRWSHDEVREFVYDLYAPYLNGQEARRPVGATLHSSKFKLHWLGIPKTSAYKSYELRFVRMGKDNPRQKIICSPGIVAEKLQDRISAAVSEPIFLLVKSAGEGAKPSEEIDSMHGARFAGEVYLIDGKSRSVAPVTSSLLDGNPLALSLLGHVLDRLAHEASIKDLQTIYKCEFAEVPYYRYRPGALKNFSDATSEIRTFLEKEENPNLIWKSAGRGQNVMNLALPFLLITVKPSSKSVSSDSCLEEDL